MGRKQSQRCYFRRELICGLVISLAGSTSASAAYYFAHAFAPHGAGSSIVGLATDGGTVFAAVDSGWFPENRTVEMFSASGAYQAHRPG